MDNGVLLTMFNESQAICNGLENELKELKAKLQQSQEENKKLILARGQAEYFKKLAQLNIDKYFESADNEKVLRDALEKIVNKETFTAIQMYGEPKRKLTYTGEIAKQALEKVKGNE